MAPALSPKIITSQFLSLKNDDEPNIFNSQFLIYNFFECQGHRAIHFGKACARLFCKAVVAYFARLLA